MIYFDTAALVKLIRREVASDALVSWLGEREGEPWVSSALVEVEVPRALRRGAPELMGSVPAVLRRLAVYDIDDLVRSTAAEYQDPELGSLDAIHLATASAVFGGRVQSFVTYDKKVLAAAEGLGLPIAHPGA